MSEVIEARFVIVGGGIAGISCIETLSFYCETESIILLTESPIIKAATNLVALGKSLTRFDIEEKDASTLPKNVQLITDKLYEIDSQRRLIRTAQQNRLIKYDFLCLCTGARPKLIDQLNESNAKYIIGIRDTESVSDFEKRIQNSRKILIVGNGGIASELVYELKNIAIDWVIKDKFVSQTFVDPGAATFFQNRIIKSDASTSAEMQPRFVKRMRYTEQDEKKPIEKSGAALGPDWHTLFNLTGKNEQLPDAVTIHYQTEIKTISIDENRFGDNGYPAHVQLQNGKLIECDFIVSATGVTPSLNFQLIGNQFKFGPDGGIFVNEMMESSIENIFAAGDVCFTGWEWSQHWFQMRLWTQARQMGAMAGKSMAAKLNNEQIYSDFCFELFGHVTQLFGYQVVLLGKYNGQGLDNKYEALLRVTKDKEYIKYILVDGRLRGAILIGETGLEETTENLILNQLDLSPYGDDILDPDIDIEDYFD